MSTLISDKLKSIRADLGLSQRNFAEMVGIPESSYKNYELDKREMGSSTLLSLLSNENCKKYSLWFLTGDSSPDIGQVAPGEKVSEQQTSIAEISQDEFQEEFIKTVEDSLLMFCHLGWFEVKLKKEDKVDIDTCAKLILKDVTSVLRKMPRTLDNLNLVDKTG